MDYKLALRGREHCTPVSRGTDETPLVSRLVREQFASCKFVHFKKEDKCVHSLTDVPLHSFSRPFCIKARHKCCLQYSY